MLGLRHFNGHAIDLFLGNIAQFQNDGIVHLGPDFMDSLCQHFALGHRHLAVALGGSKGLGQPQAVQDGVTALDGDSSSCSRASGSPPPWPAEQPILSLMQELHGFLKGADAKINHRITFVATTHDTYAKFQNALFAVFPESE